MGARLTTEESATTTENSLVSVVITTWNRKCDLHETLMNYLQHSYPRVEIIVVDNNSTDGTIEMIEQEFPSVRLIKLSENTGVRAYNIGMQSAKGEIIIVSDNDSYLERTGIEKIVKKFQEGDLRLAVIACEIIYVPEHKVYLWYSHAIERKEPDPKGYPAHTFIGAGAAIRRSVLEEVGYYPEEFFLYMNEVDLSTRIIGAGYEIRYSPDIVAFHKFMLSARDKNQTRLLSFRNAIWYYWKYFPVLTALGRSLIRIPFEIVQLTLLGTNPLMILATCAKIVGGMPEILRKRRPIPKQYVKKALGGEK